MLSSLGTLGQGKKGICLSALRMRKGQAEDSEKESGDLAQGKEREN